MHEGCAEDGINYIYSTPNHLKHDNQDNQSHHDTYPPQLLSKPSERPPLPHLGPDPAEASERSSSLPTSRLSPPKKSNIVDAISSMNMEQPDASWNHSWAPAKKNGGAEPEEESEMREGMTHAPLGQRIHSLPVLIALIHLYITYSTVRHNIIQTFFCLLYLYSRSVHINSKPTPPYLFQSYH